MAGKQAARIQEDNTTEGYDDQQDSQKSERGEKQALDVVDTTLSQLRRI